MARGAMQVPIGPLGCHCATPAWVIDEMLACEDTVAHRTPPPKGRGEKWAKKRKFLKLAGCTAAAWRNVFEELGLESFECELSYASFPVHHPRHRSGRLPRGR